ncbi:hypothetical protein [Haliangium sp.]|uniref:hypothetical protein n=1 Tax=Haliangium sp. TaxID=2663208 RepID=UPI003D10E1D4
MNPSEEVCDDGNVLACGTCNADCSAAQAAAEHSTAEITVVDAVAVVEASTLTLNDGIFGATVFEFSADSAIVAGRVRIDTSGVNTNDGLRDAIATAINAAPSLLIEATIEPNGVVALRNLYAGEHGDQAIDFSGGAELSVADMSDGLGGRCVADVGCRFDDDCATGFCDLHTDTCAPVTRCGNGVVDPGETCDDGNHRTETECAYGPGQCTHCDATCETSLSLVGPFCGDGAMHPGEDCDDGDARDTGNGCSADCKRNDTCGDGVLESVFESCDDGNADACGTCSANCQTLRAAKAIGSITVVAVNDSPSLDGKVLVVHDGINAATTFEFDTNGALTDGTHRPIMLAPNANRAAVRDAVIAAINHYNAPLFVVAVANGDNDGVIDLEHEFLGDFSPALMTTTAANFEVDGLAGGGGRDCVDGRSCVVGEDCVSGRCAVPPGQVTGFCQATTCGDGRLDIGEQCDDGTRADEGNGCDAVCRRYDVCGDGVLHAEFEVCDDGNTITETQCPYAQTQCTLCDATCRAPLTHQPRFCGDGVHEAGEGEDCDDGNASCGSCDNGCELDLVQATGTITTQDIVVALDGKTLFLEDGLNNPGTGTVFEFDIDGQLNDTSRVRISVSGSGAASVVRDAIIAAVNRVPDLFITAISSGADRVELTNDHPGVFGNVQILGSVFINVNNFTPFSSDGMKDGTGRDCSNGEVCRSGEDCASGRCLDGVCEPSLCGNGVIDLDAGEQCDDSGRSDRGCDATCRSYAVCGDGVVHSAPGVDEVCDDGNALDCGDCAADCRTALPGSPATGCIKVVDGSAVTDGRVIIVDDGANPATVFELDKDGIVGDADHIPVAISDGQSADEVRDALIAAINGVTADYITAAATGTDLRCGAGAVVHVSHGRATAAGNVRILDDAFIDGFVVHGMDGGVGVGCDVGVGCEADGHCANHACAAGLCADLGGCGDGALQGDEFCDDGNAFQCGACDQACSEERLAEAKGSMSRVPSVQIADGDTLTIDDGVNPVTVFEFDKDGILSDGGHVAIAIANAADDTDVVSAAIVDAVNGVPSLFVQASIGTPPDGVTQILLNHDLQGAVGNRPLRSTADALEVDGMHSGAGRDCPTSVGCLSDDDCGSGICDPSAGSPGVCVESLCGDGVIDPGEQCDDGNGFACGTCSFDCQTIQGSAAAFGVITIVDPTLITDGDTLVINDRVNEPIVFEFDEDGVLDNLLHVPVSLDRLIAGVGDGPEDTRKDDTTLCLDLLDSIVNRAEGLLVAAGLQTNCPEISIENLVPGTTHGAALSIRTQLDGGLSISDVSDGAGHDCIAGTSCQGSDDCASGICDPSTKVCIASSCGDGAQDATEACDDGNALSCGTCAHDCGTAKQDATAIGEISVANPAKIEDGDLLVLGDGLHQPTTFELDKNGGATVGDVMVVVDADAEVTRDNLLQAINGVTGLAIRATAVAADGKRLSLANDNVGAHGNVLIWEVFADSAKAGGGITVEGMEGGVARDCRDGIGCTSASDCSSGVCDASAGRCVACAADGDCAGTEVCTDGVCQAPPLP